MKTPEAGDVFVRTSNKAFVMLVKPDTITSEALFAKTEKCPEFLLIRLTSLQRTTGNVFEVKWTTGDYYTTPGVEEAVKQGKLEFLFNMGTLMDNVKEQYVNGR